MDKKMDKATEITLLLSLIAYLELLKDMRKFGIEIRQIRMPFTLVGIERVLVARSGIFLKRIFKEDYFEIIKLRSRIEWSLCVRMGLGNLFVSTDFRDYIFNHKEVERYKRLGGGIHIIGGGLREGISGKLAISPRDGIPEWFKTVKKIHLLRKFFLYRPLWLEKAKSYHAEMVRMVSIMRKVVADYKG